MPQTREQKKKVIEDLKEKIGKQKTTLFFAINGLKAKDIFELRKKLRQSDCLLVVSKKTLLDLAFKAKKVEFDKKNMKGQLALVFGFSDELLAAKITYQFALKNDKLKVLGGLLENKFISDKEVIALAKLPSKEELYSKVVGTINAPLTSFVRVLQGNIKGLVCVLSKINN